MELGKWHVRQVELSSFYSEKGVFFCRQAERPKAKALRHSAIVRKSEKFCRYVRESLKPIFGDLPQEHSNKGIHSLRPCIFGKRQRSDAGRTIAVVSFAETEAFRQSF